MKDTTKGAMINMIISGLNEQIKKENKKLCAQNLYSWQKPLHGADMFLKLAYMNDSDLEKIAKACGI